MSALAAAFAESGHRGPRMWAWAGSLGGRHDQRRHTRPGKQTESEDERGDNYPRRKLGCDARGWHGVPLAGSADVIRPQPRAVRWAGAFCPPRE
jgi:hypothetical protein